MDIYKETNLTSTTLGQVTTAWPLVKLNDYVVKVGSGVTPKGGSKAYVSQGIPLIRSQNVLFGKFKFDDIVFITDDQHHKMKGSQLQPNDVLLNITGASIGRCAVLPASFSEGNVNQHVCIIRPNELVLPKYLGVFLNSSLGQNQIWKLQAGGNREGLNFQQIRNFDIPLMPLNEQQNIILLFETVDQKIDLIEQKITQTEQLKKGLMQKLFTQGVGTQDEDRQWQPHSELNETTQRPVNWQSIQLIDFLELKRGYDLPVQNRVEGEYNIIASNGILGKHNTAKIAGPGVVTGRSGTIGKVFFSDKDFWPLNTSLYIRDFKGNDPKYCFYLLLALDLTTFATGTGVPTLNRNIVHKKCITVPKSLAEQQQIADILSTVDQKLDLLHEQKAETQQLKKGLMQKLLTGQWRVNIEQ